MIGALVILIGTWCEVDSKKYTQTSRELCVEYLVNCVIDAKGGLINDEPKIRTCVKNGRRRLHEIKESI